MYKMRGREGPGGNRTHIRGFAVRCITTLPPDPEDATRCYIGRPPPAGQPRHHHGRWPATPGQCRSVANRSQTAENQPPMTDLFAEARDRMVDSQVRPNRVTDPRIT